ncbi:helix-turn-helix domain-containing protein [Acaricomes phytoseiuli]|uniref:helix-turn-helix domain-containing protein n=1 Tax=Acaricomes phytoseiuli TaxID=291968 RepID=UPI00222329A0|nr:helix-turn-helix domain-containing protein [Acaricomes phytoseiuli]MCW1249642.1 helix-turn-helix domain-containing protein [Acaricomes phytoseiuli]
MSFQAMTWAQEAGKAHDLPPAARLVLLTMANYADQDGDNVFPSLSTLVEDTGLSKNTVKSHIRKIQDAGLIVESDPAVAQAKITRSDRVPNVYRLGMSRGSAIDTREGNGGQSLTFRGSITDPRDGYGGQSLIERGSTIDPEPVKEPIDTPKGVSNARARTRETAPATAEAEFEIFYSEYPRHEKKIEARKAFIAARKKTALDLIMAGVARYQEKIEREQTEPRFIALPSSWLRGERWEDSDEAPPRKRSPWDDDFHRSGVHG